MHTDLMDRRQSAEARIEAERRVRGAAVLDGRDHDDAGLRAAEGDLQALEDAAAEAWRRKQAAARDEAAAARKVARAPLEQNEADRITALAKADRAFRDAFEAIGEVRRLMARVVSDALALGANVTELSLPATDARLVSYIASRIKTCGLRSPSWDRSMFGAAEEWAAVEARIITRHIAALTAR
ncbi:hypothetical protein [Constrictibacter sp. MBR-5]|uniref:hypothetical protein n=1 Tax=Constrictibacter sp. MBR-5 TaxID=3156467 RepID=UPI003394C33F